MDNLEVFDERYCIEQVLRGSGTGAMVVTLDNAAAVDAGSGLVTIPATGHGLAVGTPVYISGTTNYDGLYEIAAVATNTFDIRATYAAETFAGTETAQVCVGPMSNKTAWQLKAIELHLSAAASTSENFTASIDASDGSAFDINLLTRDMSGVQDIIAKEDAPATTRNKDDLLKFAYANSDGRTWGLVVWIRRER